MLKRLWDNEPTVIASAIRSVILCAMAFGLQWTAEQVAAVMLAIETVLMLFSRSKVAPIDGPQNIDTKIAARSSGTGDGSSRFIGVGLLACALTVSSCGGGRVVLPESPVGKLAVIGREVVNGGRAAVATLDLLVTSQAVTPANAHRVLDALNEVQKGAASLFTVLEQIDALPTGSPDRATLLAAAHATLAELEKWMTEAIARPETEPARRSLSESLSKARDGTAVLRGRLGVPTAQGGQLWKRAA